MEQNQEVTTASHEYIDRLKQDLSDLLELVDAKRCSKCGRYYLAGFLCQWCGTANSVGEEEDE